MQYQGGKYRIANQISETIISHIGGGYKLFEIPRWKTRNIERYFNEHHKSCRGGKTLL